MAIKLYRKNHINTKNKIAIFAYINKLQYIRGMPTVLVNKVRGNEVTETINFVMEECCNCGIPFFFPKYMKVQLLGNHNLFYCPNGHPQHYTGKSEQQKRIEELEESLQNVKNDRQHIENSLLDTISEKNKLSRQLKRVHRGVCPCCNRTFDNLHKHMETKHKDKLAS
jgi:hypothetical protein